MGFGSASRQLEPIKITVHTPGWNDVADALRDAPESVQKRSFPRILRAAGEDLKTAVLANMRSMLDTGPHRTYRIERALRVKSRRDAAQDILTGERASDPIVSVEISRGETADDQDGAWYAHLVHWGHGKVGGGTVPGKRFMTKAFEENAERIAEEALRKLESAIVRSLAQGGR